MEAESSGEYIGLVVQLEADADGHWHISVDGTATIPALPLLPLALVVRLWRTTDTGTLRGHIQLAASDQSAPIQSNAQLEQLIRAWLLPGAAPAAAQ